MSKKILDSRESTYGPRVKNMEDVAAVWSGILGSPVRADQVTLMMAGYKLVRASTTPDYEDNIADVEGYALMFREIIGDRMVAAATAEQYQLKKAERDMTPEGEACIHCRNTICDGNCEAERIEEETAVQKQWADQDTVEVELQQQLKKFFAKHNLFLKGHDAAAHVTAAKLLQMFPELRQSRVLNENG